MSQSTFNTSGLNTNTFSAIGPTGAYSGLSATPLLKPIQTLYTAGTAPLTTYRLGANQSGTQFEVAAAITNGTIIYLPVSYTHLDVYKRQVNDRR